MRTFAGIPEEYGQYEDASVVIIPVPYDGTSTYGKGADKGPEAIFDAAENMELYDIETNNEVYKNGIFIAPTLFGHTSPETMVKEVDHEVSKYIETGKFVTLLGGEHSVSIGSIRAFAKKYNDLTVLQLDAHSDLRPEYEGSKCNHACAMHEASYTTNLVQVGIRSMDASEVEFLRPENLFTSYDIRANEYWKEDVINALGENVYITIDLDAFDPSIMPSTGTPEPGGLLWNETLDLLKMVFRNANVVGFDIVELAPIEGNHAPDFMAAKLYYKLLSYKYHL
ncbi:MAG: agmatinase [Fluviicola sp. XM-24bin1]|nr:MAG: agmatinase [Fluviicola sp. XM-24bin1]